MSSLVQYAKRISLICLLGVVGCQCGSSAEEKRRERQFQDREDRIEQQRDRLAKERASIEQYLEDRSWSMQRSGTGLYYRIDKDSAAGPGPSEGDRVRFHYTISLLSGEEIYTSAERGPRELTLEKEDAEIGLHEALTYLGVGDAGSFILPSHLAFGVAGDLQKVPPLTALLYELEVIEIEKSQNNDE